MPETSTVRFRRIALTTAATMSLGLAPAACGGDSASPTPAATTSMGQVEIDKALSTPTELTFWTWVPDIEQEVALFEKKYPAIDVKVVNAGQGVPQYTSCARHCRPAQALRTWCRWSTSTSRRSRSPTVCWTCGPTAPRR
jgi:hypothetical protein